MMYGGLKKYHKPSPLTGLSRKVIMLIIWPIDEDVLWWSMVAIRSVAKQRSTFR